MADLDTSYGLDITNDEGTGTINCDGIFVQGVPVTTSAGDVAADAAEIAAVSGDLTTLHTTAKTTLVAAINELAGHQVVTQQTHAAGAAIRADTTAHLQADLVALLTAAGVIAAT